MKDFKELDRRTLEQTNGAGKPAIPGLQGLDTALLNVTTNGNAAAILALLLAGTRPPQV